MSVSARFIGDDRTEVTLGVAEEQPQSYAARSVAQGHEKATADPSFVGMTLQWVV
jgi:hypothetical protein